VLEYCDHHKTEPLPAADANDADESRRKASDISEWDAKFIQVSQPARTSAISKKQR
jgi:S-phase kinase-associated protein 1